MVFLSVALRKTKRTLFGKRKTQDNNKASKQPQAYSSEDLTDRENSLFMEYTVEEDTPITVTPATEDDEHQEDDDRSSIMAETKTTVTVTPVISGEEELQQEELVKTKTKDELTLRREFRLDNMERFLQKLELYRNQEHDYCEYDSSSSEEGGYADFLF
jgi:hypothetical protein